jgi:hypothetical protein
MVPAVSRLGRPPRRTGWQARHHSRGASGPGPLRVQHGSTATTPHGHGHMQSPARRSSSNRTQTASAACSSGRRGSCPLRARQVGHRWTATVSQGRSRQSAQVSKTAGHCRSTTPTSQADSASSILVTRSVNQPLLSGKADLLGPLGCSALANVRAINVPLAGRDQRTRAAWRLMASAIAWSAPPDSCW